MNDLSAPVRQPPAIDEAGGAPAAPAVPAGAALLQALINAPVERQRPLEMPNLVFGSLLALAEDGQVPIVSVDGCAMPAGLRAVSLVDLHGAHVGRRVALMFEGADLHKPVVVGLLQGADAWPLPRPAGQLEVDADGRRLIVSATSQIELRCGKSRITLKHDGQIEIVGETIVSQAAGANRVRGGSVQLN